MSEFSGGGWGLAEGVLGVRGLFSAKALSSSFAEVRMGLLIEPTYMEDEDEDQENEKEDARDGEQCKVEGRRVSRQQQHWDDMDDVRKTH